MDNWKFFKEIDFTDLSVGIFHIDTRDFHCSTSEEDPSWEPDFFELRKHPDNFFYSPDEVQGLIERLFVESGGKVEWRMLSLTKLGEKPTSNWQLKYIRIHRTERGLLVCNNKHYVLSKEVLSCPVNQDYLCAH